MRDHSNHLLHYRCPVVHKEAGVVKLKPYFKWFDFWVGLFYDTHNRRLYIGILPMIGVLVQFKKRRGT